MVSSMSNYEKVRELNEIPKLKRSKITFKKIGHSSKDTSKRLLDMYKRIDRISHGKTDKELLNRANNPKLSSNVSKSPS